MIHDSSRVSRERYHRRSEEISKTTATISGFGVCLDEFQLYMPSLCNAKQNSLTAVVDINLLDNLFKLLKLGLGLII